MQTFESQLLYLFAALRCGGQGLHLWGYREFCCRPRNSNNHLDPISKKTPTIRSPSGNYSSHPESIRN